jgi:diaminopimelate decarboxylase
MNYPEAEQYASIHGDAFYVYDETKFIRNYERLLAAFQQHYRGVRIAYSYKTNYTPAICHRLDALGGYAEVVSAMEYALARRLGVSPERIIYNGPWKSDVSLQTALREGAVVNLDSGRDLTGLLRIAAQSPDHRMRVGLRCNFPLAGHPDSRFGFDVERPEFSEALQAIRALANVQLAGLHCHFPHRDLHSFAERATRMVDLVKREFRSPPGYLSIGGGFFGQMPESLRGKYPEGIPTSEDYGRTVGRIFAEAFGNTLESPALFIEPGTALVADTFEFVARVVDIKEVRGRRLACVAGSIFNISPYSRAQNLPVRVLRAAPAEPGTPADIVGYTCIEGDVLAKAVPGPLAVGNFIVFSNVGSYSVVMKPPFILPSVPIIMRGEGPARLIKKAESMEYIFENFVFPNPRDAGAGAMGDSSSFPECNR